MKRVMTCLACSALAFASLAEAQDKRLEISGNVGYTLSDGVSGDAHLAGDGNIYDRIDPQDSVSFSLTLGYFVTENWEIELLWDRQPTKLEIGGTNTFEIGDLNLDNYHGLVSYNFGDSDAQARPFISFGLGATRAGSLDFTGPGGVNRSIDGSTKFSGTVGAGVKVYPSDTVGLRLGARWTPTYVKSDSAGWWCDPYWGCYVLSDAQYANQFEFSAGVTLRF